MKLTAKQEAFAQLLADGAGQAEAYRKVYATANKKPETVWQCASRMAADRKVVARVAQIKSATVAALQWTREDSVRTLRDVAEAGESRAGEKVAAVKELNSMHGFNEPVKHDVRVVGSIKMVPLAR